MVLCSKIQQLFLNKSISNVSNADLLVAIDSSMYVIAETNKIRVEMKLDVCLF